MKRIFFGILLSLVIIITFSILYIPRFLSSQRRDDSFRSLLAINKESVNRFPDIEETEVILIGDIMLGRTVMTTSLDKGDPIYPFQKVKGTLKAADIVFANLENPVIRDCPRHFTGFTFCTDSQLLEGVKESEIEVLTIANNHTLNYGRKGFEETKTILTENGISYTGDGNLVIKEKNGITFGFLGFDFLSNKPTEKDFELVRSSAERVNVLIVGVHWGVEYQAQANAFQTETAKKLIESGADVISGHHPHWVQNDEKINGKPVYYSLGNFIFDQMWSEETKKGLVVRLTFEGNEIVKEEKLSVYIRERGQPELIQ